jgi:hypothetical protein
METPQSESLNKRDIMAKFGDRVLWHPEEVKKEYLGLDENLAERDLVGSDIADKYEQARITDSNTYDPGLDYGQEFLNRFDSFEGFIKPLNAELLKSGPNPITLSVSLYKAHFKLKGEDEISESFIDLKILKRNLSSLDANELKEANKNREIGIGNFVLKKNKNDVFSLGHRYVCPEYRGPQNENGERIGNILLKASEQVVQSYANKEEKPKTIELHPAQLDVIMWLHANGYTPKTDNDKKRLEKVINADESLIIADDNFIWEKDKWVSGANMTGKHNEAFEIVFEKKFEPKSENTVGVIESTRERTGEVLKIKNVQASALVKVDEKYVADLIQRDPKQEGLSAHLKDQKYRYFMVTGGNGEKLGIIGIYDNDRDKNAIHIIVDPEYRGTGLAKQFYDLIMNQLDLPFITLTIDFDPNDPDGEKRTTNVSSMKAAAKLPDAIRINDPFYDKFGKAKFIYPRHKK